MLNTDNLLHVSVCAVATILLADLISFITIPLLSAILGAFITFWAGFAEEYYVYHKGYRKSKLINFGTNAIGCILGAVMLLPFIL